MSTERMLKFVQPKMERMLGKGKFVILNIRFINCMIHVEYHNQYRRLCKLFFSVT